MIKDAVRNREKELVQKGAYEKEITITLSDLKKSKLYKSSIEGHFRLLGLRSLTIRILGGWAFVVDIAYYIDISILPYPNRQLRTRLRDDIINTMFLAIETDGDAYEERNGIWVSKI